METKKARAKARAFFIGGVATYAAGALGGKPTFAAIWTNGGDAQRADKALTLAYIQPGKPQQNGYVERYNRSVRHERLDLHIFETVDEVPQIVIEWLCSYNHERPNISNGGMSPPRRN